MNNKSYTQAAQINKRFKKIKIESLEELDKLINLKIKLKTLSMLCLIIDHQPIHLNEKN